MSKFSTLLPKIILGVLMVASVVPFVMVFAGGSVDPYAEYKEPVYTDVLLYWVFGIFFLALLITLGFALIQFVQSLIKHPLSALKSMLSPILLVGVLLFGFFGMNDYQLQTNDTMPTFDGEISLLVNQLSNMCIFGIATLALIAVLLIVFSGLFKSKVKDA